MPTVQEELIKEVNDNVGGILFTGSDDRLNIDWISSGLLAFDKATQPHQGKGGIPVGRMVELFGPTGSGKTTLALSTIAQAQADGKKCAFLDNENAFNPDFARMLGVDIKNLIFSQDNEGERTLDAVEALVWSGELDLIVIDSIAGLATCEELKGNMDDKQMADRARMWSKATRKLCAALNKNDCTLLMVNQIREDVGGYGNPETTPGGRAIKFHASMRIDVRQRDQFAEGRGDSRRVFGHKIRFRIKKNKVGKEWGVAFADLWYDTGFDLEKDLINTAEEAEVVDVSGGWRTYVPLGVDPEEDDDKVIKENGKDNFVEALSNLEDSELLYQEIRERILLDREEPLYYKDEFEDDEDEEQQTIDT